MAREVICREMIYRIRYTSPNGHMFDDCDYYDNVKEACLDYIDLISEEDSAQYYKLEFKDTDGIWVVATQKDILKYVKNVIFEIPLNDVRLKLPYPMILPEGLDSDDIKVKYIMLRLLGCEEIKQNEEII